MASPAVALHEVVVPCRICGAETTVHLDLREPISAERFTPGGDAEALCGHLTTETLTERAVAAAEREAADLAEWNRHARAGVADLW